MTLRTRSPCAVIESVVEFLIGVEVRPAVDGIALRAIRIDPFFHPHVDFLEIRVNRGQVTLFKPREDPFAVLGIQSGQRFMRNPPVLQVFSGVPVRPIIPRPHADDYGRLTA